MHKRSTWKSQEDEALKNIVESMEALQPNGNLSWHEVSKELKNAIQVYKTPKQCLDRWNNHLKPDSIKETEWSYEEKLKLFNLQEQEGNRWTYIASQLPGKKDSCVKNYFYATLRKSIRLINHFISEHRNEPQYKNFKLFPENCIGKIIAQDQQKRIDKMKVTKNNIDKQARKIKLYLLEISREKNQREVIQNAIRDISEFNRNCRRLRCKKRKHCNSQYSGDQASEKLQSTNHSQKSCKEKAEQPRVKVEESSQGLSNNHKYPPLHYQYQPTNIEIQMFNSLQLHYNEREAEKQQQQQHQQQHQQQNQQEYQQQNQQEYQQQHQQQFIKLEPHVTTEELQSPYMKKPPHIETQIKQTRQFGSKPETISYINQPRPFNQNHCYQRENLQLQFQGILSLPLLYTPPEELPPREKNTFQIQREMDIDYSQY